MSRGFLKIFHTRHTHHHAPRRHTYSVTLTHSTVYGVDAHQDTTQPRTVCDLYKNRRPAVCPCVPQASTSFLAPFYPPPPGPTHARTQRRRQNTVCERPLLSPLSCATVLHSKRAHRWSSQRLGATSRRNGSALRLGLQLADDGTNDGLPVPHLFDAHLFESVHELLLAVAARDDLLEQLY
jgi:hypothetical protein